MIAVDIYEKDGFKYAYCTGDDIEYGRKIKRVIDCKSSSFAIEGFDYMRSPWGAKSLVLKLSPEAMLETGSLSIEYEK